MSDDDATRDGAGGGGTPPDGRGSVAGGWPPPDGPEGPAGAPPADAPDEALRSLERLQALGGDAGGAVSPPSRPAPPAPVPRRKPPRLASAPRPTQAWARIAAPVAFLVAVIVVVSLAVQSGVVGDDGREATPAAKATKTATKSPRPKASPTGSATSTTAPAAGDTRSYTVKPGDTLSGIAARFDTTVTAIQELNADADLTTLQPGQKLTVPRR